MYQFYILLQQLYYTCVAVMHVVHIKINAETFAGL